MALPLQFLGLILANREHLDEAIPNDEHALKLNPDFEMAHMNLGIARFVQERLDLAVEEFQKAVDLKPDFAGAKESWHRLVPAEEIVRPPSSICTGRSRPNSEDADAQEHLGNVFGRIGRA